jgi:hypothetical protein
MAPLLICLTRSLLCIRADLLKSPTIKTQNLPKTIGCLENVGYMESMFGYRECLLLVERLVGGRESGGWEVECDMGV